MQFQDTERQVFQYFDGLKQVYGDPLALQRGILIHTAGRPQDLESKVNIDLAKATPQQLLESSEATIQLVGMIREVFQMVPYNRETNAGAQDAHCLAAYAALCVLLSQKKTTCASLPTASQPTVGLPNSTPAIPSTSA